MINTILIYIIIIGLLIILIKNYNGFNKLATTSFITTILINIYKIFYQNLSNYKQFPFLFSLFLFILFSNLIGMIPYNFTITSHIILTLGLSFMIFFGMTYIGFQQHGLHFFSYFIPHGAPSILLPLLVVIEIISYFARALSLGIRLFANIMSGHTLLKIMANFTWTLLNIGGFLSILSLFPFVLILIITLLELGIACLQAYVFIVLSILYINDSYNLH